MPPGRVPSLATWSSRRRRLRKSTEQRSICWAEVVGRMLQAVSLRRAVAGLCRTGGRHPGSHSRPVTGLRPPRHDPSVPVSLAVITACWLAAERLRLRLKRSAAALRRPGSPHGQGWRRTLQLPDTLSWSDTRWGHARRTGGQLPVWSICDRWIADRPPTPYLWSDTYAALGEAAWSPDANTGHSGGRQHGRPRHTFLSGSDLQAAALLQMKPGTQRC